MDAERGKVQSHYRCCIASPSHKFSFENIDVFISKGLSGSVLVYTVVYYSIIPNPAHVISWYSL